MSSVCRAIVLSVLGAAAVSCSAAPPLRVCADPNNMPYSNQQQQGFENQIASLMAKDMGMRLEYTWYPQRGAFFKKTLDAGKCDVVMGVPENMEDVATTRPYYRSSYAFVSRTDRNLRLSSLDDPRLRTLRIGVHILGDSDDSLPPVHALTDRGIVKNLVGYSIFGQDLAVPNPSANLIHAVVDNNVDVAIAWGPLAGYFGRHAGVPLTVTPIAGDPEHPELPLVFDIAMGTRPQDKVLEQRLNAELSRCMPQIQQILRSYGVPQLGLPQPAPREGE